MIQLHNASKEYKLDGEILIALNNANMRINSGDFIAVVGPSGCGKSTLMHILGALDRPTSGTYFLDDKDVGAMSDEELAKIRSEKIGFVFQSFNLLPRSTVLRNIVMPFIYDKKTPKIERKKKAESALRAVGLEEERWSHLSNQLSGGQMQRVAIARALVNNPDIIFADEPTGNLDSKTGLIVLQTFQRLNKEGGHTIILITHDKNVAAYAKRVIEIRDGEIISDKTL